MVTVRNLFDALCELAPLELQMDFDNSGFLLGRADTPLHHVLLALDVTDDVIGEALACQAELIVSHHPLIFTPLRSVTDRDAEGRRILKLIENRIAVISMHTNLDIAEGGVNDALLEKLGLCHSGLLEDNGCGRIGILPEAVSLPDFLSRCRTRLNVKGLRYVDAKRPVYRVAVMGGSGSDSIERASALGCDTYVTADIKYHQFQKALDLGLNLIDADHFSTENPVIPHLAELLRGRYPELDIRVSASHHPIISFA